MPALSLGALTSKGLPACGTRNAEPFGAPADARSRPCQSGKRQHQARHTGIGFKIPDIDSEACFVPDHSYRLLDNIVDEVRAGVTAKGIGKLPYDREAIISLNTLIGDTLAKYNFGLYVPTDSLADALAARNKPGQPERYLIDCDTSSMIYLTVANSLKLHASLVEITLQSGAGHNNVRWQLPDGYLDWDTNGRGQCVTPSGLASHEGRAMSERQVLGYAFGIRGDQQLKRANPGAAIADFRQSISMYPESPKSANNFAWMYATKLFPGREEPKGEAMENTEKAVRIERNANNVDTYACVLAAVGRFSDAVTIATEAVAMDDSDVFRDRLAKLKAGQDCIGAE